LTVKDEFRVYDTRCCSLTLSNAASVETDVITIYLLGEQKIVEIQKQTNML